MKDPVIEVVNSLRVNNRTMGRDRTDLSQRAGLVSAQR
jgi:hypothetical protein